MSWPRLLVLALLTAGLFGAAVSAEGPPSGRPPGVRAHPHGQPPSVVREYLESRSPAERQQLRELGRDERRRAVREGIEALTPEERDAMRGGPGSSPGADRGGRGAGGWHRDFEAMTPDEREAFRSELRGLSPDERQGALHERFGEPDRRPGGRNKDRMRRNFMRDYVESLPDGDREALRDRGPRERHRLMRERLRGLLPEERERLRERFRSLGRGERERMRERMRADDPGDFGPGRGRQRPDDGPRREWRERLRDLPPEEQHALRDRLRDYRDLSAEEQARLRARLDHLEALSPEQREQLEARAERWRGMPEERRERLRRQMQRLRELAPDERLELLDLVLEEESPDRPAD